MAYYTGINGALYIDGSKAGQVRNWSLASSVGVLDTTNLGDTDRTVAGGLRSTQGSCTIMYHSDETATVGAAAVLINKVIKSRTTAVDPGIAAAPETATMKLLLNDGSAAGKYVEGEVHLTSVSMNMAQGEVFSATCSFEFNGAPTASTL
jgi:hypothetical protein